MEPQNETLDLPKNPAMRRAWLVYQLRLRGLTVRELARREGVSHVALSRTMFLPSSHLERVIAKALGTTVRQLFAERYGSDGQRLHATRAPQRSRAARRGNLKAAERV